MVHEELHEDPERVCQSTTQTRFRAIEFDVQEQFASEESVAELAGAWHFFAWDEREPSNEQVSLLQPLREGKEREVLRMPEGSRRQVKREQRLIVYTVCNGK